MLFNRKEGSEKPQSLKREWEDEEQTNDVIDIQSLGEFVNGVIDTADGIIVGLLENIEDTRKTNFAGEFSQEKSAVHVVLPSSKGNVIPVVLIVQFADDFAEIQVADQREQDERRGEYRDGYHCVDDVYRGEKRRDGCGAGVHDGDCAVIGFGSRASVRVVEIGALEAGDIYASGFLEEDNVHFISNSNIRLGDIRVLIPRMKVVVNEIDCHDNPYKPHGLLKSTSLLCAEKKAHEKHRVERPHSEVHQRGEECENQSRWTDTPNQLQNVEVVVQQW